MRGVERKRERRAGQGREGRAGGWEGWWEVMRGGKGGRREPEKEVLGDRDWGEREKGEE